MYEAKADARAAEGISYFIPVGGVFQGIRLSFLEAKAFLGTTRFVIPKSLFAKGVTNPNIQKLVVPEIPLGMTSSQFGKELIQWGTRPEGALNRISSINAQEVAIMQQKGLTRNMAIEWRDFYVNDFSRNANNITAKNRVDLMNEILKYF